MTSKHWIGIAAAAAMVISGWATAQDAPAETGKSGTTKKACPADCSKPCCPGKTNTAKEHRPPDCAKPCRAGKTGKDKKARCAGGAKPPCKGKETKAGKACPPGCAKPCCAGKTKAAAAKEYPLDVCPVSGQKLGAMGPPVIHKHKGREVRFCCAGCVKTFQKNPEAYLKKLDEAQAKRKMAD